MQISFNIADSDNKMKLNSHLYVYTLWQMSTFIIDKIMNSVNKKVFNLYFHRVKQVEQHSYNKINLFS